MPLLTRLRRRDLNLFRVRWIGNWKENVKPRNSCRGMTAVDSSCRSRRKLVKKRNLFQLVKKSIERNLKNSIPSPAKMLKLAKKVTIKMARMIPAKLLWRESLLRRTPPACY